MKKIVIIGATSYIAQDVAKIYAAEKNEFVLVGRNRQHLEVISQDLKVRGASQVHILTEDLNQISEHAKLVDAIWSQLQNVDIVLLAHGILGDQRKAETDANEFLSIINSNFVSHASLMNLIAEKMKTQKKGTIAVISSVAGERGKQSNYIYGAAKAAKSVFSDGLRNRLFPYGVHVLTLKLGFVDTPMTKSFKKGPIWAKSPTVAKGIVHAIAKKKDSVYLPFFWRYIMMIITSIPERIFKKLSL
ncbi:short-chain dehydrogenase [Bdellovibrio bacteriovorus]|uniref:Short-chain dehydrogenase n=1 Tax=Bdellovibrio bacteriovorus TaxID=959 RepID=A0A150WLQ0_BDEBC|nr:SDR family oxidoreductase [Bdellovibrio bacteriovorus]KYG64755.1 short-chain dehydrogenase [Bdellovibrio bacteriovorus]